ncbi:hypothetical protein LOTGIDRAFT_234918 [Lottia gigantea]|uniref:Orn/DAP/Arg decarboxylase 2 N-terminal domain-containing protein n=1 Tax=Lottia gigantea TaxID=225164 RepID=V3ZTG5_LOTGI|nr:hypothetical protein LOTGIDRAFT_234918 [Lottia gigantea]ESO87667.1 hypothetical protein LOTGIDRAFT_234918 [Lottia gigantea]
MAFTFRNNYLHCEDVKLKDIQTKLEQCYSESASPVFIYSQQQLEDNIKAYKDALGQIPNQTTVNYSIKANSNPELLKIIKDAGCSLTLVSGNELRLALKLGFDPKKILLNGNGKTRWETTLAVKSGCLINVDSDFDLRQAIQVCHELKVEANILLRINLNIDVNVHPYVSTGMAGSKFGIDEDQLDNILDIVKNTTYINVVGLHCHLGSTIEDLVAIRLCMNNLKNLAVDLNKLPFVNLKCINIGGGLNIDYYTRGDDTKSCHHETDSQLEAVNTWIKSVSGRNGIAAQMSNVHQSYSNKECTRSHWLNTLRAGESELNVDLPESLNKEHFPNPGDLIGELKEVNFDKSFDIIVEPGRSIVGNTAVLLSTVLGCKESGNIRFIITTGSMTEVIRPSLYGSYHHIDLIEPSRHSRRYLYNVVGPVCESADFLGKERFLNTPHVGCGLAIWDVGAYCYSMASNYNLRGRAAEILVSGSTWRIIKKPESFEDMMTCYSC